MGWCSATYIFDEVVRGLLDTTGQVSKEEIISNLIDILEDNDWDCQGDSDFIEHPLIKKIFTEKHRGWFEEEEE